MTLNIGLSQTTPEAVAMPYGEAGINVYIRPMTSGMRFNLLRMDLYTADGLKPEDYDKLSEAGQRRYTGLTLHKHFVTNIDDYIVGDGIDKVEVSYNKPALDSSYETMGQQVLCTDYGLQEAALAFAQNDVNYKNGVKVSAMGNSEPPPSSGPE